MVNNIYVTERGGIKTMFAYETTYQSSFHIGFVEHELLVYGDDPHFASGQRENLFAVKKRLLLLKNCSSSSLSFASLYSFKVADWEMDRRKHAKCWQKQK